MGVILRAIAAALLTLLLGAPAAPAHPGAAAGGSATWTAEQSARAAAVADAGPCTDAAAAGMPQGPGHDHLDPAQHKGLACRIEQVAYLPLREELTGRPELVLGEMDVKRDIAAVAATLPEGGVLFFDVADPAKPKFLSWFRHGLCEGLIANNNCGAFIDLSADGKTAFLAIQNLSLLPRPGLLGSAGVAPLSLPGVLAIDISDPRKPKQLLTLPVLSEGGVHTARSHPIKGKGEYVFAIANGFGVNISKVSETPRGDVLLPVTQIDAAGVHDTFIQDDPIDKRTYLYLADGFDTGFRVYDVSDPAAPVLKGIWDPTPECSEDWYGHTIDIAYRGDRRYVTMPAEIFSLGTQTSADQSKGCGKLVGMGDRAGPLWIVDASDFSKLARLDEPDAAVRRKSEALLVATWTNPAGRAGGDLMFSPHNQQIVGDKIYLSNYHGGVFVLDASGAFAGRRERPRELGWIVPSAEASKAEARPLDEASPAPLGRVWPWGRPSIWDMTFYKGYILAADMVGGFYSLRYEGDGPAAAGAPETGGGCRDRTAPRAALTRRGGLRLTRAGVRLRGTASDRGCSGGGGRRGEVARVLVSIGHEVRGGRCRFLSAGGALRPARSCARPTFLPARGTTRWSFQLRRRLAAGRYRIAVRAIDASGNVRTGAARRIRVR